jgi:hypothetical protein
MTAIWSVDGANFIQRPSIEDVDLPSKVAESRECNESCLRIEGDKVPGVGAEVRSDLDSLVEQDSFGRYVWNSGISVRAASNVIARTPIDHTEFLRVRAPSKVMNRTFLVCLDAQNAPSHGRRRFFADAPSVTRQSKLPAALSSINPVSP